MSSASERRPKVENVPPSPGRLSAGEWFDALKRSSSEFIADDCVGLAQQIAYASLLAFFPAMAFLVGTFGLFHLFDHLERLLDPIAPDGVIRFITSLHDDSSGGTSAVAFLLFFAFVYFLAPNKEPRTWKWITPGSLLGAVLWLVLSGLFALYVKYAGNYTKTYGTLAAGVILLLWLNYSAFALLYGAELNAELERRADIRAAGGERAGLVKPARRGT